MMMGEAIGQASEMHGGGDVSRDAICGDGNTGTPGNSEPRKGVVHAGG